MTTVYAGSLPKNPPRLPFGPRTLICWPSWKTSTRSESRPVTSTVVAVVSVAVTLTSPLPSSTYRSTGSWVSNS